MNVSQKGQRERPLTSGPPRQAEIDTTDFRFGDSFSQSDAHESATKDNQRAAQRKKPARAPSHLLSIIKMSVESQAAAQPTVPRRARRHNPRTKLRTQLRSIRLKDALSGL
jgi:hypothetical protein